MPTQMPAPDTYKDIIIRGPIAIPFDQRCQGCGKNRWFAISNEGYKFCGNCFINDAKYHNRDLVMRADLNELFKDKPF